MHTVQRVIFEAEIFAGEAKLNFEELKFQRLQILKNFKQFTRVRIRVENGTYDQLCSEQEETVCGYHVYTDISKLPCLPAQIFAKIIIPCDQNIPKSHCWIWTVMVTRFLLLFQSGERPACTASLVALLEVEGSVWDPGPSGSGNRLKYR